ncbi:MAG: ABC transporter substrate-binding protein [Anaerolineae bacterium]
MSEKNRINRRDFLRVSALAAAGVTVAACAQPAAPTVEPEPTATQAAQEAPTATQAAKEAPTPTPAPVEDKQSAVLVEQVAAGTIPPLDERLPTEPMTIDRTGKYGGTMRLGTTATSLLDWSVRFAGDWMGTPLRLSEDLKGVVPNVWKRFEISDDATVITGYMRQGLKWNDGEPHTADDWMFWYEDLISNEELTPTPEQYFTVGGELMVVEKLDDYTIRMTFAAPNPSFPMVNLGHEYGFWSDNALPRHYLEQFHINYNPQAPDDAKAAGFDFWYQYFGNRRSPDGNAEVPLTAAFIVDTESADAVTYRRNPYYWMVDADGKQLTYVDELYLDRIEDGTVLEAKAVAGEFDFVHGWQTATNNYQTYKEGEAAGGYITRAWKSGLGSHMLYMFNMNYEDDVWRELFSDKRWRQALSVAINRDEINEVVFFGLATPAQLTAHVTSRAYKKENAEAWAQYDVDLANQMLDEIGLEWDENHELRLLPDGRPIQIVYDSHSDSPIHELVFGYWKTVGVQVDYKVITRDLLRPRIQGNQEMMSDWGGDECMDTLLLRRPKWFAPIYGDESTWAPMWGLWYNTKGEDGWEPPEEIKQLYEWHDQYRITDDVEWADKILASQAENIWSIGTVADGPVPQMWNKDLKNVPEVHYFVWDNLGGFEMYPEAWYYDV